MSSVIPSSAYGPIVVVAVEQTLPREQRIVDDPLAYPMLPTSMKLLVRACHLKPVRQVFFNLMENAMPGMWNSFPCRKRYVGDKVIESLNAGIDSLVILGAGLDTLAYRLPQLSSIRVYEVDLPENIAFKKKRLEALYGTIPSYITLAPIDFEAQKIEDVLQGMGYSFDQKSLFIWEAVTQYLTEAAVRDTFRVLAKAKPGSRLVFTYVLKNFIEGRNTYGLDRLYQRFRVQHHWWLFGIDPQDVAGFIGDYSWNLLEHVGADEFAERYLRPAGRMGAVAEIERAVYAEKRPG